MYKRQIKKHLIRIRVKVTYTKSRATHASRNPYPQEQFYLECINGFYLLLSIFFMVSLAFRVKNVVLYC